MQMRIGWSNTLTLVGLLGLTLTVAEAGNTSSSNAPTTTVTQTSATTGSSSDSMRQELDQLKRQMQAIQDRIQELEKPPAEKPAAEPARPATEPGRATPQPEQPPAAPSPVYGNILPGVRLGGYGSFRFEGSSLKDVNDTFTYRRLVLSVDANIAERLRSGIEIELERFTELELERTTSPSNGGLGVEQAVGGSDDSELSVEQAWLEYELEPWLRFQGGMVLVPMGRFNLHHDDNLWDLPRRSLIDTGIPVLPIKAAWSEVGMGFVGDIPAGPGTLSYHLYAMNGAMLDTELETIAQTRTDDRNVIAMEAKLQPVRGTANIDLKNGKAFAGRVAYNLIPDYELGLSGYYGRYTPQFLSSQPLWAFGVDGKATFSGLEVQAEYIYTHFSNISKVANSLAQVAFTQAAEIPDAASPDLEVELEFELAQLATVKNGYWLNLRYPFSPDWLRASILGRKFANPQLIPVVRWEQAWLNGLLSNLTFENGVVTELERQNRFVDRITVGLAYRPVPLVVFHLAYEYTWTNHGKSLADVTNFLPAQPGENTASAVLVGVAFGF
jgi:hypothetical protein